LFIFVAKKLNTRSSACHNKIVMERSRCWGGGGD